MVISGLLNTLQDKKDKKTKKDTKKRKASSESSQDEAEESDSEDGKKNKGKKPKKPRRNKKTKKEKKEKTPEEIAEQQAKDAQKKLLQGANKAGLTIIFGRTSIDQFWFQYTISFDANARQSTKQMRRSALGSRCKATWYTCYLANQPGIIANLATQKKGSYFSAH